MMYIYNWNDWYDERAAIKAESAKLTRRQAEFSTWVEAVNLYATQERVSKSEARKRLAFLGIVKTPPNEREISND